jgi:hypothetical protein
MAGFPPLQPRHFIPPHISQQSHQPRSYMGPPGLIWGHPVLYTTKGPPQQGATQSYMVRAEPIQTRGPLLVNAGCFFYGVWAYAAKPYYTAQTPYRVSISMPQNGIQI